MTPRRAAVCGSPFVGRWLRGGNDRHLVATRLKLTLALKLTSTRAGLFARQSHRRHHIPCVPGSALAGGGEGTSHACADVHVLLHKAGTGGLARRSRLYRLPSPSSNVVHMSPIPDSRRLLFRSPGGSVLAREPPL